VSSNGEPTGVQLDISKYEGCKKADWRCVGQPYTELAGAMAAINRNGPDPCTPADLELWADAPLLLEEVKRLRNKIRLLDIVEDRDGALDRTLLNSGVLTEKELKGAYSDSELVGVEFHD